MTLGISRIYQALFLLLAAAALATPQELLAQNHVISSSDLQKDAAAISSTRQKQIAQIQDFVSSPRAQEQLRSSHMDYQQVKNGVSQLSDEDLARLSARAVSTQKDFAAGILSQRDLLLIILAVAALILIIVAVR